MEAVQGKLDERDKEMEALHKESEHQRSKILFPVCVIGYICYRSVISLFKLTLVSLSNIDDIFPVKTRIPVFLIHPQIFYSISS